MVLSPHIYGQLFYYRWKQVVFGWTSKLFLNSFHIWLGDFFLLLAQKSSCETWPNHAKQLEMKKIACWLIELNFFIDSTLNFADFFATPSSCYQFEKCKSATKSSIFQSSSFVICHKKCTSQCWYLNLKLLPNWKFNLPNLSIEKKLEILVLNAKVAVAKKLIWEPIILQNFILYLQGDWLITLYF